jgi:TetR/AcrR family transcriptional repressor of lmrAB and yxaGH operons
MARRTDTRLRVLQTAAHLFRSQGYHGTGLNQVLAEGGAPKGSLYFHFPGGKEQLAVEAVELGGRRLCETITGLLASAPDVASGVDSVVTALADDLERSGFRHGCPVGPIAQDTVDNEAIQRACAAAFASWHATVERALRAGGVPARAASDLATMVLAAVEGAQLLARSQKDATPLRSVGAQLRELVRSHLPEGR